MSNEELKDKLITAIKTLDGRSEDIGAPSG
jgi:hypothetical protein